MSVYIYTLPKAGTYFVADLLERLGLENTGFHIAKDHYLDTKTHTLEENAQRPTTTTVQRFFAPVVRELAPHQFAFGHFPLPLNPQVAPPHLKYICAYRHPKRTLMSEFIDFRFRRTDLSWISAQKIENDVAAFERYLEVHGTRAHQLIFKNVVTYRILSAHPLQSPLFHDTGIFLNFDKLLRDPKIVERIAEFVDMPIPLDRAQELLNETLNSETKTKATDLNIDREQFWSERAIELYEASGFPLAIEMGRDAGLEFDI